MTLKPTADVVSSHPAGAIATASLPSWSTVMLILYNEIVKSLLIQWSYKFNFFMESAMTIFLFLGIVFFVGNGEIDPERLPPSMLGFIATFYASVAIGNMAYHLREEAQQGTLEQWYMSPAPTSIVQFGRTLATFLVTTVTLLPVAVPLIWTFEIELAWRWAALPVFVIMLLGVYGFGFLVGGATLLFKQIGPLANMVQNLLLFLNGSFVPLDRFPSMARYIAHTLPTSQGIILLRRVILDDDSLLALWQDGSLLWLVIHSALYLVIGVAIFAWAEWTAKRRGLLGQY